MSTTYGECTDAVQEIFLPVDGWPYEISNLGTVKRACLGRNGQGMKPLKWQPAQGGYPFVMLSDGGRSWPRQVHLLVAAAFLGPTPAGMEVNHKDRNRWNPKLSNLEFVTPSQNILDAVRNGHRGENRWNSKLNKEKVKKIREMHDNGDKVKFIAEALRVSAGAVYNVLRGHNWRHVK